MRRALLIPTFVAALSAGCLQKETSQTWYLSPDGGVIWTMSELNVRSDEADAVAREREEQGYIHAVQADMHGPAAAFRALDAQVVRTRVIRAERPFGVITEARFTSVRAMVAKLLTELRAPGDVTLTNEGSRTTLRIRINIAEMPENEEETSPMSALADGNCRFILTDGKFVSAKGFKLQNKDREAVPDDNLEAASAADGFIELMLAWER